MAKVRIGATERVWQTSAGQATTAIWYPSLPAEPGLPYLNLYPANAAWESTPVTGSFPLILFVSGNGSSNRYTHSFLTESLAARGFWVIAPETPKIGPAEKGWQELYMRPLLVHEVLSAVLHSEFSNWIDTQRILYIGHSNGGYIGLILAGARPDFTLHDAFTGVANVLGQQDFSRCQRIPLAALLMLDPALSSVFSAKMLTAIRIPTALIYSGIEDANLLGKASHYKDHLGNLRLSHCFADAGHYVYCNVCPPVLTKVAPQICLDRRVKREEIHHKLIQLIEGFLDPWRAETQCEPLLSSTE